jgi:thymidylate synthase
MKIIRAKTISDAWFQAVRGLAEESDEWYYPTVQRGSFENEQYRRQYPGLAISIEYPEMDIVPTVPAGVAAPTTMEYIIDYYGRYIVSNGKDVNEEYTYGSRILQPVGGLQDIGIEFIQRSQLSACISMLKKTPLTNQAVISISEPNDIMLSDPPCLRQIDFKAVPVHTPDGVCLALTATVYFRSWDVWAGLPSNLGAIQLLKDFVASEAGLLDGRLYAYSAGAHIYGYQEEIAKIKSIRS